MSLRETVAPIGPLDDLEQWGHPWHGLVKGGTLSLPYEIEMQYPQPASGDWPYQAGTTSLIDFGAPATTTPPEDAAQGMEWRSLGTLSGAESQLYGKPLGAGNWVYKAPSGDRWLIRASSIHGKTAQIISSGVNIIAQRFGEFPAEGRAAAHSIAVALPADWGQAAPEIKGSSGTPIGLDKLIVRMQMSKPDGSGAIFALDYSSFVDELPPRAFGFAELVIAGDGAAITATLNIIATREQTAGEGIKQPWIPYIKGMHMALVRTWTGNFDPPCTPREVTLRDEMMVYYSGLYEYTPTNGSLQSVYDDLAAQLPEKAEDFYDSGWLDSVFDERHFWYEYPQGSSRMANIGTILAMFYRPDGTIGRITLDEDTQVNHTQSSVTGSSDSPGVTVYTLTGVATPSCERTAAEQSVASWSINWGKSTDTTKTVTLKVDGATVWTKTRQQTMSSQFVYSKAIGVPAETTATYSVSYQDGYSAFVVLQNPAGADPGAAFGPEYEMATAVPNLLLLGGYELWREVENTYVALRAEPHRYAPGVIGMVEHRDDLRTPSGNVATPDGPKAVTPPTSFQAGDEDLFGSYCPVTKAVALDVEPVCWV